MLKRWSGGLLTVVVAAVVLSGCLWAPSVRYDGGNSGYNAGDTTLTPAVVTGLTTRFSATLGSAGPYAGVSPVTPVVANGHIFVPAAGRLLAFDAAGVEQCAGTPTTCEPQWTGSFGHPWWSYFGAEVAGDTVYVLGADGDANGGAGEGALFAFDVNGITNCGGTPRVCEPRWTANVLNYDAPTVVDGRLYVYDMAAMAVKVFDAGGVQGCGGSPKVCQPLWTAPTDDVSTPPVRPAVVGGSVYIQDRDGRLTVSDANGVQGCSGAPKVCAPMWTSEPMSPGQSGSLAAPSPVVMDGRVFVIRTSAVDVGMGEVVAFDAAGSTGCSGTPTTCQPLWRAPVASSRSWYGLSLAAANGKVYVPDRPGGQVRVYDAAGAACSGGTVDCSPLFVLTVGGCVGAPPGCLFGYSGAGAVTIANGLALISAPTGLFAFDAAGVNGCVVGVCSPVAQNATFAGRNGFVIADGQIFSVAASATEARLTVGS